MHDVLVDEGEKKIPLWRPVRK